MDKRYIGAIMLVPLLIFPFLGGYYLKYLLLILSLCGMYEFYRTCKECEFNPISFIGYGLCLIYYIYIGKDFNLSYGIGVFIFTVFILMTIPVLNTKYNFIDVALTILPCFYVAIFFSFMYLLNINTYGNYLIWIIFIASWGCDTAAYYSGRYLGKQGKHKLIPKVSPNKTVEGAIGGLVGSVLGCTLYGYIITRFGVIIPLYHYIFIGLLGGIFSQLGDLVASAIKRYAKIKDYSNLIPGHGGILDRFDSILFVSVIVYYYVSIFINI